MLRRLPLPQLPLVPAGSPSLLLHGLVGVDASEPGEKLIIPGVISSSSTSQNYISDGKQRKLLLESMGDFSRRADINLSMFPACNILSKSIVYSLHLWSIIRNLCSVREGVLDCSTYPAKNARSYPLQWTCRITSYTATANTTNTHLLAFTVVIIAGLGKSLARTFSYLGHLAQGLVTNPQVRRNYEDFIIIASNLSTS